MEGVNGVFSKRNINKGEVLGVYSGVVIPEGYQFHSEHCRSLVVKEYSLDGLWGYVARFNTVTEPRNGQHFEVPENDARFNVKVLHRMATVKGKILDKDVEFECQLYIAVAMCDLPEGTQVLDYYGWTHPIGS